jgi:murein DD-endopeptidase MepM/ murein hydrolase activator NlpD
MATWEKMADLLKLGISKLKRAKSHTSFTVFLFILLFFGIPSFACTRSVVEPAKLTEMAIRFEITKIALETSSPAEKEAQILPIEPGRSDQPTSIIIEPTPTSPVALIPLVPIEKPQAAATRELFPLEPILTTTLQPDLIIEPIQRNTFPVELINPGSSPQPETKPTEIPASIPMTPTVVNPDDLPDLEMMEKEKILYVTQNGDMLDTIAHRFGTSASKISAIVPINTKGFLEPNITLFIPPKNRSYLSGVKIIPDEYIVFSSTATDYNIVQEIKKANGYLANYQEYTADGLMLGSEIIYKASRDYSINPIVLLALLEYKSHWVYGHPVTAAEMDYPMGWIDSAHKGLYKQITWAAGILSTGFYGWRYGSFDFIPFYKNPKPDHPVYFEPSLNAGSVAIQYLFSQIYTWNEMDGAIYGENGFYSVFTALFGNVWENYEPNPDGLNAHLSQIEMILPFSKSEKWALTGGPHLSWSTGSPWGAIDLAPPSSDHGCAISNAWVTAAAPGIVVRSSNGVVVVDMDGDGYEETGWVMLYLHVATLDRVAEGTLLPVGGRIGHPSCEGGVATGTHLHIARKYNGEWIAADGPLPFLLCGWTAFEGNEEYLGGMVRGDEIVIANSFSPQESIIHY